MALVLAFYFYFAATGEELFQRGVQALKQNDNQAARIALEEAVKLAPREPLIWLAVAEARLRGNEAAGAAGAVVEASRLAPLDPTIVKGREMFQRRLVAHARRLLDNRDEKLAEAVLREAQRMNARDAEVHRLLGLALYAQGRNDAAIDSFLTSIDLAPNDEALYAGLETLLPNESRRTAIETRLKRIAAKSPLGTYLMGLSTGNPAYFEAALTADPTFWPAAFALHKSVAPARALQLLEQVVMQNPEYAPAHYALAQLYARQGDREKALAARKRHHELTAEGK